MAIEPGQSLHHYRIVEKIGAGGMGEVWKANDPRLDRDVAIKVLPAGFARDEQLRARFDREARAISSLNHPNICTLFDVGEEDGTHFLVMELIEGESLGERVRRDGAFSVDQVIKIGSEITSALEAAHRNGIVHRDLKPDNVMLTPTGAKLLDFGLAKTGGAVQPADGVLTSLPTQAENLTQEGTILGTFQYMAPEQLEGIEADARSDLFALGAILYEMTTGRRAFEAKGRASLIAAIVEREPESIASIKPLTPPALERVIKLCLRKDPDERWQTAHDVRLGLEWIDEAGSAAGIAAPVMVKRKTRERLAWIVAALLLVTSLAVAWLALERGRQLGDRRTIVASISPPEGRRFETYGNNIGATTLSPDGNWLTYVASGTGGRSMLSVRPLGSDAAQPLAGTEGAIFPFWSPDSRQIGFFSGGKLKKIDRSGGAAITICDANDARGGKWSSQGVILFAPATRVGLSRVSAAGGVPEQITKPNSEAGETTHRYPVFLRDGERYLYLVASHDKPNHDEANAIWVGSLDSTDPVRVMQSGSGAYFALGHLLNVRDGFLMARPFDIGSLSVTGEAFSVGENVGFLPNYFRGAFAVSESGLLAFQRGIQRDSTLTWMDRQGKPQGVLGDRAQYNRIRLSPDETRLAVSQVDPVTGVSDIWVFDVDRNVKSRLTFDEGSDALPVWSPDGTRIAFSSTRSGSGDIYVRPANGGSNAELLWGTDKSEEPEDWSPDGQYLVANRSGEGGYDLWLVPLAGDEEPRILVASRFDVGYARFSPDGKWLAYLSNESGQYETFVTRFPSGDGKWQVSTTGADWLIGWKRDGTEIYFMDLEGNVAAVEVSLGERFVAEIPRVLFPAQTNETWASAGDGERFLVGEPESRHEDFPITLVVNWLASR